MKQTCLHKPRGIVNKYQMMIKPVNPVHGVRSPLRLSTADGGEACLADVRGVTHLAVFGAQPLEWRNHRNATRPHQFKRRNEGDRPGSCFFQFVRNARALTLVLMRHRDA